MGQGVCARVPWRVGDSAMKRTHRIWLVTAAIMVVAPGSLALLSDQQAGSRVEEEALGTVRTLRDLLMTFRHTHHQRFHAMGVRFRNVSDEVQKSK